MPLHIDDSKATHLFFAQEDRTCPACGGPQRYYYKSSGHYFYLLSGLHYVDGQIVYCPNGRCTLRYKPMHPPEELALVRPLKGHGFDVIACIGRLRHGEELTRPGMKTRLARDYPLLEISERQIQNLYDLYGELVSGSTLVDEDVIATIKANKVMVLSLDGAKPMRDNDSVWFVRDVVSGITLAAQAMTTCTTEALVKLLTPVKDFSRRLGVRVDGVVSDKEAKILAAVREVFPKVRHQYCQLHYVANLAKPLVKADQELANEIRKSMRGMVGEVEKSTKENTGPRKSLNPAQADVLDQLCLAIRSVLRFRGKPPFEPPGLRLLEQLKGLRDLVRKMKREKGGAQIKALDELLSLVDKFQTTGRAIHRFYDDIWTVQKILFKEGQTTKGAKHELYKLRKNWERRLASPRCEADLEAAEMLGAWCDQTDSYWPGLFYCYGDYRIPATNNEMELWIKEMKQLERRLSGNPNPAARFIRHAAINALLASRPRLPDETFLASRSEQEVKAAVRRLNARRRKLGLSHLVRRDPTRFAELVLERWKQSSQESPNITSPATAA
jgi:hypothetical protein